MSCSTLFFKLNNGNSFPMVGFGTYIITGQENITKVIDESLKVGYRSFDTAAMYENEKEIGIALKELLPKYGLTRKDVYLTSKLLPADQGSRAERAARESIKNLQCEYLDLYLIHWPGSYLVRTDPKNAELRKESWSAIVKLHKLGLIKNAGVSNYTVRHLRELISDCDGVIPTVNQLEWHPHHHPQELLDECRAHGILLQAYSSLGGSTNRAVIDDPKINEIAKAINRPVGLVLLKWALQQDIAIIPKAMSEGHIRDNFTLGEFTIPEEYMEKLNNLSVQRYDWNPEKVF